MAGPAAAADLLTRAATYHPDKVPPEQQPRAELIFRTSKFAQEVLTDKVKRFAYDRLGPDIFESSATAYQQCKTIGDFVALAVRGVGVYYLMFAAVTTVFTFLNIMPHGKYVSTPDLHRLSSIGIMELN